MLRASRIPQELAAGTECRGAADLPEHVAVRAAVNDYHARSTRRRQRAANLKNENESGRQRIH